MLKNRLKEAFIRFGDYTACVVDGRDITYKRLYQSAEKIAGFLLSEGSSPVILYGKHSIEEVECVVACILAGRAYVPVKAGTPMARLSSILDMTKASLILTDSKEFLNDLETDGDVTVMSCQKVWETSLAGGFSYQDKPFSLEDIAYMIFTSGSTGTPKGVPISYKNLECFIDWISDVSPLNSYTSCHVLNQASLSFDLSVTDLYYALCNGHTWVAKSDGIFDGEISPSSLFLEEQIDVAVMTPSGMRMLLVDPDFDEKHVPNFKCVFFCGERLPKKTIRKLWERFPKLTILNAYGPTEATSAVCAVTITKKMLEDARELPVGEVRTASDAIEIREGEIVLWGDSVFTGYMNLEHSMQSAKCSAYATGDLGEISDGLLYCNGRKDSQVKYKGYRIELYDIENNLNRIDGVRESAVVAAFGEDKTVKSIQAFCVADREGIDEVYIRNALLALLPDYMIPKTIKLVKELPLNENKKIDRKALEMNHD